MLPAQHQPHTRPYATLWCCSWAAHCPCCHLAPLSWHSFQIICCASFQAKRLCCYACAHTQAVCCRTATSAAARFCLKTADSASACTLKRPFSAALYAPSNMLSLQLSSLRKLLSHSLDFPRLQGHTSPHIYATLPPPLPLQPTHTPCTLPGQWML